MNAPVSAIVADDMAIAEARAAFRRAFERRHWFSVGDLPALPTMSHERAEVARDDAYDLYTRAWQPFAWDLYLAECAAIIAATRGKGASKSADLRRYLVERDGSDCWLCGDDLGDDMTVEHLHPRALGGGNELANLVLCHDRCNKLMGHNPKAVKLEMRGAISAAEQVAA